MRLHLKLFNVEQLGMYKFVFEVSLNLPMEMYRAFAEIFDNNDAIPKMNQFVGTIAWPLL